MLSEGEKRQGLGSRGMKGQRDKGSEGKGVGRQKIEVGSMFPITTLTEDRRRQTRTSWPVDMTGHEKQSLRERNEVEQ